MTVCDVCGEAAEFTLTAAYSAADGPGVVHPLYATYPAPMARLCGTHLSTFVRSDQANLGATPAYLLRPVS